MKLHHSNEYDRILFHLHVHKFYQKCEEKQKKQGQMNLFTQELKYKQLEKDKMFFHSKEKISHWSKIKISKFINNF